MINHLSTVHGIKNNRDEMKFIPIKTAINRKTAGEWLACQVCLDGISMNRLAKSKFQAHAFSSMGLKQVFEIYFIKNFFLDLRI